MGSNPSYTENRSVSEARETKAPEDAIYRKGGYDTNGNWVDGPWVRLGEVTSAETRWYFKQNHPNLVAQFTDWS